MGTMTVPDKTAADTPVPAPKKLPPAAQRALAEAEARRRQIDAEIAARPAEKGGRGGLDPNRYGDWEIKGITADF
ncbi:MAG: DUF1674 domain-containing protein [Hyphomicrobiales bacterium]|nr:MAG: DUF1674 domain-containing protein [Hyphomicrobiales bacterium]